MKQCEGAKDSGHSDLAVIRRKGRVYENWDEGLTPPLLNVDILRERPECGQYRL